MGQILPIKLLLYDIPGKMIYSIQFEIVQMYQTSIFTCDFNKTIPPFCVFRYKELSARDR